MEVKMKKARCTLQVQHSDEDMRKGPWSVDEDTILVNHITKHGHAHWNSVARISGLKRSGKSCRLRWLNYLRPDVRRGNITIQEQITILELYSRWGNRWSKIARHLPGRTDNEIKNYWRTRVIKQAKNLNCDVGSEQFKDALRYVLIPRLIERIQPQFGTYTSAHVGPSPSSPGLVHHQHGFIGSPPAELQARLDSEHFGYDDVWGLLSFNDDQIFEQGNRNATLRGSEDLVESLWDDENLWLIQQLCDDLEINHNFLE